MRRTWLVGILVFAAWLWVFRFPLFLGDVCALRDAGNFYYPLFSWECAEWSAGRIPMWNPCDGLGAPVLADATSSVLYPGKLIFALPIPFDRRFTLYVAGHVLFAAWSVYFVTRRWGATECAAGIGAMSYAFGGYVLFQHCNPVFLVSAAWLPLAIWLADEMLVKRNPRRAAGLGMALAMMTLGGDPQTACHAGILAVVYALLLWRSERGGVPATQDPSCFGLRDAEQHGHVARSLRDRKAEGRRDIVSRWSHLGTARPMLLGFAAITAFGVAAVQVLPTWELTRRSDRAQFDAPRGVNEIAGSLGHRLQDRDAERTTMTHTLLPSLFAPPQPGTHAARTYLYSFGPWRLIELLWPNVSGRMYPIHQRWISALPAEGHAWTPTLYLGLIPFIAAMMAWRSRNQGPRERWLKWLVVLGVLGSFGWYGLGWIIHEVRIAVIGNPATTPWIAQPVGGWYWLLVTLLPGYAYFRYPAKWFVVAALGCSLLSARGTDQFLAGEVRSRRLTKGLSLVSGILAAALLLGRRQLLTWFHGVPASDLYGPIDADGAWFDVIAGILFVAVGSGLLWLGMRAETWRNRVHLAPCLLLLTVVDLLLANQWLVATVSGSVFTRTPQMVDLVRTKSPPVHGTPPARLLHAESALRRPRRWKEQSDPARLAEIVTWERNALLHRHHLPFGVAALDAPTTIPTAEWLTFLQTARRAPPGAADGFTDSDFDWLGLDFWVERSKNTVDNDELNLVRGNRTWPRVWLTSESRSRPASSGLGTCRIARYEPQHVEVEVTLKSPAMLVLSDAFDPNWVVSTRDLGSNTERLLTIKKVAGLVRGVELPAGEQRVVFKNRPRPFFWGAAITLVSLIAVGIAFWPPLTRTPAARD